MDKYESEIEALTLIPSSGGVYNIWKDDNLIFSKKELGRFPSSDDEVITQLG